MTTEQGTETRLREAERLLGKLADAVSRYEDCVLEFDEAAPAACGEWLAAASVATDAAHAFLAAPPAPAAPEVEVCSHEKAYRLWEYVPRLATGWKWCPDCGALLDVDDFWRIPARAKGVAS